MNPIMKFLCTPQAFRNRLNLLTVVSVTMNLCFLKRCFRHPQLPAGRVQLLADHLQQAVAKQIIEIYLSLLIIFPVAFDPNRFHRPPAFQLPHRNADTGLADAQFRRNVIQAHWLWSEIEKGVNLTDDTSEAERLSGVATGLDKPSPGG